MLRAHRQPLKFIFPSLLYVTLSLDFVKSFIVLILSLSVSPFVFFAGGGLISRNLCINFTFKLLSDFVVILDQKYMCM